jgi:hypothetical protein
LGKTVLEAPMVIVVEAKKNDFEQGWGQCLAELAASQKLIMIPTSLSMESPQTAIWLLMR